MKDFLLLFSIYRSATRRSIAALIYKSHTAWKYPLWLLSAIVLMSMALVYSSISWIYIAPLLLASLIAWGFVFNYARRSTFQRLHKLFPEQMNHYAYDYQFIRYRRFLDSIKSLPEINKSNLQLALDHIKIEIETQPSWSASTHPLVVGLLGAFFAILGGAAGRWDQSYLIISLCSLSTVVYFTYMGLGLVSTRKSNLLEFKRFLHWASHELE